MNRESINDLLRPLSRHRDWLLLVGLGTLALIVAWWIAAPAREVAAAARTEIADVERAALIADNMRARFVPAGDEELREWDRWRAEIADFGSPPEMRVALAQIVTRAAEDAGIHRVRARFAPWDSLVPPQPRLIGGDEFVGSAYGLIVQGRGDVLAATRLLAALPPAVDVQRFESSGGELSYLLAVYQRARPGP